MVELRSTGVRSGGVGEYWGKKLWSWGVIYFVKQQIDLHLQEVRRERFRRLLNERSNSVQESG